VGGLGGHVHDLHEANRENKNQSRTQC
jgi:hypothetical protein